MLIYIGADHRGFALKENLKPVLKNLGYEVADVGAAVLTPDDDYPVYAKLVAEKVSASPADVRGILICGSTPPFPRASLSMSTLPCSSTHAP